MCMKNSWSASASTGETSATSVASSDARKQHSRQTGASACARGDQVRAHRDDSATVRCACAAA
jgi:hypothetical protein